MYFFKSVFSDPLPHPDSPPPSSPSSPNPPLDLPSSSSSSSWHLGSSIFKTLTDNYYRDLQEFTSGFRNETSLIRQVASRAVHDLPARLESGAAIAQDSLEAVGQAVDDVSTTVSEIVGKDLNFAILRFNDNSSTIGNPERDLKLSGDVKPYSRLDAMVRGLQCDFRTYCDEVEEIGYGDWRIGFGLEERREEIERLMHENGVIGEIYSEVVPGKVNEETFWCRYFYRVDKVVKAEEARLRIVKRAISAEDEEELSWDVDDDEESGEGKGKSTGNLLKNDVLEGGNGLDVANKEKERANEDAIATVLKSGAVVDEGNSVSSEKEGLAEKSESDLSVISSHRSSHAEDDTGWDKMEDIGSGDELKVGEGSSRNSCSAIELRKRLSTTEDNEILTWDIEDDTSSLLSE